MAIVGVIFSILGPLLATAGALLLAVDVIRKPALWFWEVHVPMDGRRRRKELHESVLQRNRNLSCPPYTREQLQQFEAEYIAIDEAREAAIDERRATEDLKERQRNLSIAAIGFSLVALGSLLQAVAAILQYYAA